MKKEWEYIKGKIVEEGQRVTRLFDSPDKGEYRELVVKDLSAY